MSTTVYALVQHDPSEDTDTTVGTYATEALAEAWLDDLLDRGIWLTRAEFSIDPVEVVASAPHHAARAYRVVLTRDGTRPWFRRLDDDPPRGWILDIQASPLENPTNPRTSLSGIWYADTAAEAIAMAQDVREGCINRGAWPEEEPSWAERMMLTLDPTATPYLRKMRTPRERPIGEGDPE